jgi:hypothetical protein
MVRSQSPNMSLPVLAATWNGISMAIQASAVLPTHPAGRTSPWATIDSVPGCKVGGQSPTMMSTLTLPMMASGRGSGMITPTA